MRKIIGVTVGTPISPNLIKEKLKPVTSVNGIEADENGNVEVEIPEGADGEPGKDGISVTHSWSGTTLTVTSASGTSSADLKGEKGDPGKDGYTPKKNIDYFDGKDGSPGKDGKDGRTPVKGTDYFTATDKAEMVAAVVAELPVYDGEVVTV